MQGSILDDTKEALGLGDQNSFDTELLMYINATIGTIVQLGIGPQEGFVVSDANAQWTDLIGNEKRYEGVKAYMYLCVRMLFDPPQVGYVITAMKDIKEQTEWRLNRAREDIVAPTTTPADMLVIDGGPS